MPHLPPVHGLVDPEMAHICTQAVDHAGITAAPLRLIGHVVAPDLSGRAGKGSCARPCAGGVRA
jgi:hypothetical protein